MPRPLALIKAATLPVAAALILYSAAGRRARQRTVRVPCRRAAPAARARQRARNRCPAAEEAEAAARLGEAPPQGQRRSSGGLMLAAATSSDNPSSRRPGDCRPWMVRGFRLVATGAVLSRIPCRIRIRPRATNLLLLRSAARRPLRMAKQRAAIAYHARGRAGRHRARAAVDGPRGSLGQRSRDELYEVLRDDGEPTWQWPISTRRPIS